MRHERLHSRTGSAMHTSSPPTPVSCAVMPENLQSFGVSNQSSVQCLPVQDHAPRKRQAVTALGLQQVTPEAELNFDLIWPDSEDLFQTIMSSDAVNHWQLPLGTLPVSAESYPASNISFDSPSSFDDRPPSIGAIPSGGNHQAVHNVSNMIASLVSLSISA